ncbi:hypothetical protein BJ508DRAFT_310616 [Ascobolus immersus RN42]|uniref:Uncharacterized protein n=1 Tax=Ascobolus immersus RN42 TaxID=1160509 RepID=A0A3N4HWU2_ASCIM|nr:hypothetical protein BJ508DRAFT_310616 [Ascobolus immersus RN42]
MAMPSATRNNSQVGLALPAQFSAPSSYGPYEELSSAHVRSIANHHNSSREISNPEHSDSSYILAICREQTSVVRPDFEQTNVRPDFQDPRFSCSRPGNPAALRAIADWVTCNRCDRMTQTEPVYIPKDNPKVIVRNPSAPGIYALLNDNDVLHYCREEGCEKTIAKWIRRTGDVVLKPEDPNKTSCTIS